MRSLLPFISFLFTVNTFGQSHLLQGKIRNSKQEPLAFASVQLKDINLGTVTKEDGSYSLELEEGTYELLITLMGYKPQIVPVIIRKTGNSKDIIMEASDITRLSEVVVKSRNRDRAEDYIRNVIRNKEAIEMAAGPYSCKVYIKAVEEDSGTVKKNKKINGSDSAVKAMQANKALDNMAMAEIMLQLDHGSAKNTREIRTGITNRGNTGSLFFLSTTEGDFNFYNNLVSVPSVSQTPFISPLSYSGLLAYRFKTIKTEMVNGKKIYTVSVKPRQLSNATVEGELTIADSSWVVLHTRLRLPKYHLADYDLFEIEQQYSFVNNTAWLITRQQFTYNAVSGKQRSSGHTLVSYSGFELNKQFEKKHFGVELSAADQKAYERDSSFWQLNRAEPLTEKEWRFIHYKDSIYNATHTSAYLDSVDKRTNTITWQKVIYKGQNFNTHAKGRSWYITPLVQMYQPFQLGGCPHRAQFFVRQNI